MNKRAVAVVIDPIQSVRGRVVIDAFRSINPQLMMLGQAPRQTTSNLGHLRKPSIQALIHNLNRHYYSLNISYRKNELETQMLLNLHKKRWNDGLTLNNIDDHNKYNNENINRMLQLSNDYVKRLDEEEGKTMEQIQLLNVGKIDPKKHLEQYVDELLTHNIQHTLGQMIQTVVF